MFMRPTITAVPASLPITLTDLCCRLGDAYVSPHVAKPSLQWRTAHFHFTNEGFPQDALPLYQHAIAGRLYVTVGCDRGLIAAAASRAGALLLLDYDPAAVMQNLVNLALLLMTPPGDVADYRFLRLHADHSAWAKRGVNLASPLRRLVLSPTVHAGFRATMQNDEMLPLHHEPPTNSANARLPFRGVNYLYESGAFCHLQTLAQSGQIYPLYCNLHHETVVDRLTRSLCTLNMPLGVLDLSNFWWDWPNNPTQYAHLLPHFWRLADQQSLLLCTDVMCNRISLVADYAAYTFGFLDELAREGAHAIDYIAQFRAATTNRPPSRSTQPIVWFNGTPV